MKRILLTAAIAGLAACTVTDEDDRLLDKTTPKFSVSINGTVAHSTISQNWGPITCDDGSIPPFNPSGTTPGIAVPLQEDAVAPTYPVEITVLAMDPAGIQAIMMSGPTGIYVPEVPATVSSPTSQYSQVRTDFGPPYGNTEGMTFRYSRDGTQSVRFRVTVYDAAGTVNTSVFDLDIAPESEICP